MHQLNTPIVRSRIAVLTTLCDSGVHRYEAS